MARTVHPHDRAVCLDETPYPCPHPALKARQGGSLVRQRLQEDRLGHPDGIGIFGDNGIEGKLAGAKQKVAAAEEAIKKNEHDRRARESDIKDWNSKIIKLREQSSSVKTNEQYKALLEEIAYAEKEISNCEEKIIIGMEDADGLKKALTAEASGGNQWSTVIR